MSKRKKISTKEETLPNYSEYTYSDIVESYTEHDRLLESDVQSLNCSAEYQVERSLNSFSDQELNDHLYRIFYSKKTENITLMRRWITYFVKQYPIQISHIAKAYLDLKRLSLDEWLRCVREGRRGDILCVYLLSLATGVHTFVHLKNNKIWCTLQNVPTSYYKLQNKCEQHLVYLGYGIFLHMQRRQLTIPTILGMVSGQDPATQQLLLVSVGKTIKVDPGLTGTTDGKNQVTKVSKASAAAGSELQLARLEAEMKPDPDVNTRPTKKSMVQVTPFQAVLTRLIKQQIERYVKKPRIQSLGTSKNTDDPTARLSPVRTRSMMTKARNCAYKRRIISGRPSKLLARTFVFQVCRHILRKHHCRLYIKCRVKGCNLTYVTFNRIKDLNAHHWLYHPNSHYKCHQCKKTVHTPSTWRYHQYCQRLRLHKCGDCHKLFLFKSTLTQHRHRHISQRHLKCFHGGCYMSYKHLQDLSRHAATHQQITFDCDMCDKTFKQKRLLKCHEVVHTNDQPYQCPLCGQHFKHNNQLYRHKKKYH